MTETPGNRASGFRPALIGGLHQVTAAGHLPDRLAPSHPHPSHSHRPLHLLSSALLNRHRCLIFGMACNGSGQHAALTLVQVLSSLTEYYRWIYGFKWDGEEVC